MDRVTQIETCLKKGFDVFLPNVVGGDLDNVLAAVDRTKNHLLSDMLSNMGKPPMADYHLLGLLNAAGEYVSTRFRTAYEAGYVYLADEADCTPEATLTLAMAVYRDEIAFPDRPVKRHPDFRLVLTSATYGMDSEVYKSRAKLDCAFIDKLFVVI